MTLHTLRKNFDQSHWLAEWEKQAAITAMLEFGILKWSNSRNLPLKSGGHTDIYVNLRQARNDPLAMQYFANMFSNPLTRLGVDRIAEIPQAVTCFSGLIATNLNKPLVTIRDQPKSNRVSDADIIGEIRHGELIGLYDDVITDGVSKHAGYRAILARGGKPVLVVAVDRQQGWRTSFEAFGINMPVWSGMTLHDIRSFLIKNEFMERCSERVEDDNQIIIALDGKSWDEILPLLIQLRSTGTILKVNDLLADEGIEQLLPKLSVYGRVMVDLKFHDIPNTVANVCHKLLKHRPWACTVHASGGPEMVRAAHDTLASSNTKVLAVTLLTSIDKKTGMEIYQRKPLEVVKKLANLAREAGAHGFVCSPEEVRVLRAEYPDATIITPGVRSVGTHQADQVRIGTPVQAIKDGADYIVSGRQFLQAHDPLAEVRRVQTELANARY